MAEKSLWERTVELTIASGEKVLAPIERFIGKRSLVGDATFFDSELFPWIAEIEASWTTIRAELERALADGIKAVAIVFMHAYHHPKHEREIAALARSMGFLQVSVSHEVSPLIKLVGRGDTTVVDAYLSPILRRYVAQVAGDLKAGESAGAIAPRLMFMMSSGGLTAADLFQGKDAILSGPAGGVVGMAETGREAGLDRLIGFDMGGTSTDVSHFDGEYERAFETEVAGVRMRAPMMLIHTVAAGGGSILHFDGARFRVGRDLVLVFIGPLGRHSRLCSGIRDLPVRLLRSNQHGIEGELGTRGD